MNDVNKIITRTNSLWLSALLLAVFLVVNNSGLYPTVFDDEYRYSKFSRLLPLSDSTFPNYLYLKLYSATNYCGNEFLGCARLFNSVLFALAMPFIYLIGRSVANSRVSIAVTLLALAGPINTYTAYFMPESFYFLSFWVLCWLLTKLDSGSPTQKWLVVGGFFGASALIKPHSIFFLPAILLYIGYIFYIGRNLFSIRTLNSAVTFFLGALIVKMAVGYLLAGSAGITIFGPLYTYIGTSTASNFSRYADLIRLAVFSIRGHFSVVGLIYGVPVAVTLTIVVGSFFKESESRHPERLRNLQLEKVGFLTLAVILNLILVASLYTASAANLSPHESPNRLHLRYYNFALPLFYIVAAGALSLRVQSHHRLSRYVLGGVIAALAAYALYTNLAPYTSSFIDSPEVRGLHADLLSYRIVGGLLLLSLLAWMVFEDLGIRIYLFFVLPLFVFTSYYHVASEQRNRMIPDVYDKAGIFAKQYLSKEDISSVVIIGSDKVPLYRSLFYLDDPYASLQIIPRNSEIDIHNLPSEKDWVLIIGDHTLADGKYFEFQMAGFSLARIAGSNVIDFKRSSWPGVIAKSQGLSRADSNGTWSNSDVVFFKFTRPLPERFELHLIAHAFGPNVEKDFKAVIGATVKNFKVGAADSSYKIELINPYREDTVKFIIPSPTSPRDLGLSGDNRKLGMAFVEMQIVPIETKHANDTGTAR